MYTRPAPEAIDTDSLNFATSRACPCRERRQEGTDASSEAAWLRWWALFHEPDAWTDPEKRRAMLRARLEYQHAVLGTPSQ